MRLSEFDYHLPQERIAQQPLANREASRMLLLDREKGNWEDREFADLPRILQGDELVVLNNTRVLPARLFGKRIGIHSEPIGKHSSTAGEYLTAQIEVLLTRQTGETIWQALVRPGRKVRVGERIQFGEGELEAEVIGRGDLGLREIRLHATNGNVREQIERLGHMPLPPYIDRADDATDRERYQTVFAKETGAVAAPTAGLHFTPSILEQLTNRGVETCEITLHVGLGTFRPIHEEEIEHHKMHAEEYEISPEAAERVCSARAAGRRILAVGTTVVRALEDAAAKMKEGGCSALVGAGRAEASIFIRPGHRFLAVDQMLTNFHLPKSTLLVLVCAFAGREPVLRAYQHAVDSGYRFYSYGDCMLIR
ncbi:MAG: tRNA preQ1(34) S-adenosylmethionine ribosyltransferase-isomerase QueA [Acidobacteria bacterium]|nr:tRNA preQ1(34) S-adenosylmethionine ribosyltransferase-isomerase QueA [Acidobacteriota bacterium]